MSSFGRGLRTLNPGAHTFKSSTLLSETLPRLNLSSYVHDLRHLLQCQNTDQYNIKHTFSLVGSVSGRKIQDRISYFIMGKGVLNLGGKSAQHITPRRAGASFCHFLDSLLATISTFHQIVLSTNSVAHPLYSERSC